jgi:hypothetical protein
MIANKRVKKIWLMSGQVKSCYDLRSVGQSVLVSGRRFGPATNFSYLLELFLDSYWFNYMYGASLCSAHYTMFQFTENTLRLRYKAQPVKAV